MEITTNIKNPIFIVLLSMDADEEFFCSMIENRKFEA